jgi:16S rRNA A1518/A1519 N6-dimethyltransferase RsmA/KsgA/DIM1 with predicted DNA glycosylase/AP lyase activity
MAIALPPPSDPAKVQFLPDRHRLHRALGGVVVERQDAIFEIGAGFGHPAQGVPDRSR